jgi:hypothetical protein
MAENKEGSSTSFTDFSIEETSLLGDQSIITDLLGSETVSASPEKVEEIKKEEPKKEEKPKKEEQKTTSTKEEEVKEETNPILDLLQEDEEKEDPSKETKKEETVDDSSKTKEEEPTNNKFGALAKDLLKLGVFSLDEDEEDVKIESPEDFLERFKYEGEKTAMQKINSFLNQFGEDYQHAFEAIYVKGVHPKDYFETYNKIENFSELDLSKEDNQIQVIKQTLLDQGLEQEDVLTEVERLKNYGDLEQVAQKYHKVLIKKEAAKIAQLEQDSEKRLKDQAAFKQQYVNNVNTVLQNKLKTKEFDGIPVNTKLAQELQEFLLVDKYKTPSGETLTEFDKKILDLKRPENHELKVKVALLLKTLEKDPTLSTIQKAGMSKKSDALFEELARQTKKSSVKSSKEKEEPTSWFS